MDVCFWSRFQLPGRFVGSGVKWTMNRRVEPEILDELPAEDPRAMRSRSDLQRVNTWMRNARIMATELSSASRGQRHRKLAEIGAGDGTFLLRVARNLGSDWEGTTAVLVG